MTLFIGLMSGTSMDGIDAALVDLNTNTLLAGITRPYSEDAQERLNAVLSAQCVTPAQLDQLNTVLGREFALAVHQLLRVANTRSEEIVAIGSHGQTICHDAMDTIPYTIQLGCGHTIAALTGITVVADFRTRDLVMGGQGAPFAPIYHQALFGGLTMPTAVVNIGGIANVTFLAHDLALCGHDTGPGNCLMDAWVKQHLNLPYDDGGAWGATGRVIERLLNDLLADPYFERLAPKSLDKAYFSIEWLMSHLRSEDTSQDVQATLIEFTAMTIANAILDSTHAMEQVVVCGGGAHNLALMQAIQRQLPALLVASTQALGVNPDFIEAMMFAWLAEKTIHGVCVDLTGITGAKSPSILGAIYPHMDKTNT